MIPCIIGDMTYSPLFLGWRFKGCALSPEHCSPICQVSQVTPPTWFGARKEQIV